MGIEPTSSAWKADILADVLYPQLQRELYHNFPQLSSPNLQPQRPPTAAPMPGQGLSTGGLRLVFCPLPGVQDRCKLLQLLERGDPQFFVDILVVEAQGAILDI